MSLGTQLMDRRTDSYFEFNDDGTIRKYDAASCAHCRKVMVRNPNARGYVHCEDELAYDYRCSRCSYKYICKRCAQEMHANGGMCTTFEQRLAGLEKLLSDYADTNRYPRLDRTQAILLATGR
jgi:hypothetical protein